MESHPALHGKVVFAIKEQLTLQNINCSRFESSGSLVAVTQAEGVKGEAANAVEQTPSRREALARLASCPKTKESWQWWIPSFRSCLRRKEMRREACGGFRTSSWSPFRRGECSYLSPGQIDISRPVIFLQLSRVQERNLM